MKKFCANIARMKGLQLLVALLFVFSISQAQVSDDFKRKFELSRNYMQEFQYEKASPIIEGLLEHPVMVRSTYVRVLQVLCSANLFLLSKGLGKW